MEKRGVLKQAMPWLLILFGFFTLNMFQGFIAISCMVIGIVIVMLIERIWPELWGRFNTHEDDSLN